MKRYESRPKTQDDVTLTLRGMFEAYTKGDLNGVLAFWAPDPDVAMIGSGAGERSVGINQFAKIIMRDWSQSDSAKVNVKEIAASSAGTVAWFTTDVVFNVKSRVDQFEFSRRLTGVMEKRRTVWLLMQMHFSVPSSEKAHKQSVA